MPTYVKLSTCGCPTSNEDKEFMSKVPYLSAIGSLMYAVVVTRPSIALGVVSRFMSNPNKKHWHALKLILRYVSSLKVSVYIWVEVASTIIGYIDSDYARCVDS